MKTNWRRNITGIAAACALAATVAGCSKPAPTNPPMVAPPPIGGVTKPGPVPPSPPPPSAPANK